MAAPLDILRFERLYLRQYGAFSLHKNLPVLYERWQSLLNP